MQWKGNERNGNSVTPQHTLNNSSVDSFFRKGRSASHHSEPAAETALQATSAPGSSPLECGRPGNKITIGRGPPLNMRLGPPRIVHLHSQSEGGITMFMRVACLPAHLESWAALFRQNERLPPGGHITCRSGTFTSPSSVTHYATHCGFPRDYVSYWSRGDGCETEGRCQGAWFDDLRTGKGDERRLENSQSFHSRPW